MSLLFKLGFKYILILNLILLPGDVFSSMQLQFF